jgi:hypothetical protein
MNRLTRQERTVILIVLGLLLLGTAVKMFRHPPLPAKAAAPAKM